jgi:Matrixin
MSSRRCGWCLELDRLDRTDDAPARTAMPGRGRWWPRKGEVIFVACFMAIVAVLFAIRIPHFADVDPGSAVAGDRPPVTGMATGKYAFIHTTADGRPVTYDSCRPIRYVVNPIGMPDGGLEVVREAVREISAASGLRFTEDGLTQERFSEVRRLRQPQRYGDRWAPVLIGWVEEASYPLPSGNVAGAAGSIVVAPDGPGSERYVTGEIALNRDWFTRAMTYPDGDEAAHAVVLHELGHLLGLDHVDDPGQLMTESASGITELGLGDRQGLAAVGAGRCWPDD